MNEWMNEKSGINWVSMDECVEGWVMNGLDLPKMGWPAHIPDPGNMYGGHGNDQSGAHFTLDLGALYVKFSL